MTKTLRLLLAPSMLSHAQNNLVIGKVTELFTEARYLTKAFRFLGIDGHNPCGDAPKPEPADLISMNKEYPGLHVYLKVSTLFNLLYHKDSSNINLWQTLACPVATHNGCLSSALSSTTYENF